MINLLQFQLLTEKSIIALENNKYVFKVDIRLNKTQIKQIFQELFGVKILKINTCRVTRSIPNSTKKSLKTYKKVVLTVESDKVLRFL